MENHVRYGQGIYFRENDDLYVNLFIPSALSWEEQEVTVRQHTQFPKENTTRLTFEMDAPTELGLRLRNPEWTAGPPTVQVNGQTVTPNASTDGYLTVRRTWTSTDTVEVTLPMALRTERMPDDSDRVAVVYGPVVLAGELGTEGVPAGGAFAKDHLAYTGADLFIPDSLRDKAQPYTMNTPSVPSLEAESDRVAEWLTPVEDDPLTFRTYGVGLEENLTFRPFYDTHHQRYSVYWTLTDPAGAD
jgi:hypothetical protein